MSKPLVCIECGGDKAELTDGTVIYPHRPDLATKYFWRCPCGGYVGCHGDSDKPKGLPAGRETHAARIRAHAAFDPLWRAKMAKEGCVQSVARKAGYKWLAGQMDLKMRDCHIGHMNAEQCEQVVRIVAAARMQKRA